MAVISTLVLTALISSPSPQRFAVIIGANHGADAESTLHFATSDAETVQSTLQALGGFRTDNMFVLLQPTPGDVSLAFAQVRARLRASHDGAKSQLVVYYAGHADSGAAHLGNATLSWQAIMALARQTGAAERLLILDACRGSAAAPSRGVARAEPLDAVDIIASFSPDEQTRETAALSGGVFTHSLLAALQGVGDANGDGKVTVGEAVRYSAERTRTSEETALRNAAPANYRYRVAPHGDFALTEPGLVDALSALHLAAPGTYVIQQVGAAPTTSTQAVVNASVRTLWLPPGRYAVERRVGRVAYVGDILLARQGGAMLEEDSLQAR